MAETQTGMEEEIALRLAVVLERYEAHSAQLVRTWADMELYAEVGGMVDDMRRHCDGLSRLSVPWVAFRISHSELVFCLWRSGRRPSGRCPELQGCVGRHAAALRNLQDCCSGLFSKA